MPRIPYKQDHLNDIWSLKGNQEPVQDSKDERAAKECQPARSVIRPVLVPEKKRKGRGIVQERQSQHAANGEDRDSQIDADKNRQRRQRRGYQQKEIEQRGMNP